jgi:hypothetical protein
VLFVNPRSGGGKAARAGLAERARERGVEAVVLGPGQDLAALARGAAADGADVLGVAGGDGSLAVVAAVAAVHGIAFACIPAGTRNHFALDVGVDRHDLTGALDAFTDGVERQIDVAEVNGRMFLNNVSLGIYGQAVRRPAYRDAKVRTLLATAEEVLGPSGEAPALRLADDAGREYRDPAVVLVSNNPYALDNPLAPAPARRSTPAGSGSWSSAYPATPPSAPVAAWTAPRLEVSAPAGGTRRSRRRGGGPQPAAAVRHPAGRAAGPDLLAPSRRVAIGAPPLPRAPPAPALRRQPGSIS